MLRPIPNPLAFVAGFLLVACTGAVADGPPPVPDGGSVSADSGIDGADAGIRVQATISSATLGDQGCTGATMARVGGACVAPASDSGADTTGAITPPCGGACRPSSLQIQFTAGDGNSSVSVEIADVRLLDAGGAFLETLSVSAPQVWDMPTNTYKPWDQVVAPSSVVKAGYTLSSPSWSTFSNQSYSATYLLQVTVRIDGKALVLQSGPLNREPILTT